MTLEKVDVGGCLPGNAHGKRHGELLLGTHTVPFIHLSAKNNDCLLAAMDQTRKEHDGDQSNDRGARRNEARRKIVALTGNVAYMPKGRKDC